MIENFQLSIPHPLLVAVGTTVLGIFIVYSAIFIIDKTSYHWGKVHSLGMALLASLAVWFISIVFWGFFWGFIIGLAYFAGYVNHLMCDQVYHELRAKNWSSPRYALKLWSNKWSWDPFIILANFFGQPTRRKKRRRKRS